MDRNIGVIWCSNARGGRLNGWSFPRAVHRHLVGITEGKTVYHPFGGLAKFGTRGDIDPVTRPHVIADAWLPPFRADAFDVVILDPPYHSINQQMKSALLEASAFIARERVIWFHTIWVASGSGLSLSRSWLVRVGDSCQVRCIQEFEVKNRGGQKRHPRMEFTRGPAIKYNRWLSGQMRLAEVND